MRVEFRIEKRLGDFKLSAVGSLERGLTCIFGHNGAGKTTLMKILAGLMQPDAGELKYLGVESKIYIGDFYVPPDAWGLDVVLAGRSRFSSLPVNNLDVEKAKRYAELAGALEFLKRKWHTLSGGQKRRLIIAAALAAEADLTLLDELLEGMHPNWRGEVARLLRETGGIVAVTSHQIDVVDCCDYVVVMDGGVVKWSGAAGEFDKSTLGGSCYK